MLPSATVERYDFLDWLRVIAISHRLRMLLLTAYGYFIASMPGSWQWISSQRHRFVL